MTDTTAGEGFRERLQASIRRAGGITVLCRTTESRKRLIDLICNEVAALSKPNAPGAVSMDAKADDMDAEYRQRVRDFNNMRDDGTLNPNAQGREG